MSNHFTVTRIVPSPGMFQKFHVCDASGRCFISGFAGQGYNEVFPEGRRRIRNALLLDMERLMTPDAQRVRGGRRRRVT